MRRVDPGSQCAYLRPQSLYLPLLSKDDVAQFGVGALQECDLRFDLLECLGVHGKAFSVAACYITSV